MTLKLPSELEYSDYHDSVQATPDAIEGSIENYAEDYDGLHHVVWEHVDGSQWPIYPALALCAIQLSSTDPDWPDWCEGWATYAGVIEDTT